MRKKLMMIVISVMLVLSMAVPVLADDMDIAPAPASKPTKVQELKVLKNGYKSLKLTWQAVDGADKYQVYRSKTGKSGSFALKKTTTGTSYTNTGITCGKTYYYKIRAVNTKGKGSFSAVKSNKVQPATVKTNKITLAKAGQLKISWSKVSGATGYQVYRKRTDRSTWSLFRTVSSKSSYTIDKLLGKATKPFGPGGETIYDRSDEKYDWEYKVRAYRTVSGKKVYGYFSAAREYVPDWTIGGICEELWRYGESLEWPMYEVVPSYPDPDEDGEYIRKMTDGTTYHRIYGKDDMELKTEYPSQGSWTVLWPCSFNKYSSKNSIVKILKEALKSDFENDSVLNPVYWDPLWDADQADYSGSLFFNLYYSQKGNQFKIWLMA